MQGMLYFQQERSGNKPGETGRGTSPVLTSLPNTGLLVRFSGIAAETPEGGLAAAVGITPDILISPAKENSRDAINRLIDDTD